MATLLFGPGIAVFTVGPAGSLEKKAEAAACLRVELKHLTWAVALPPTRESRMEAIVDRR